MANAPLDFEAAAPGKDQIGWAALLVGTGIIAWSGIIARFLDVGPIAGAAWRMGLAVPALFVWSAFASRRRPSLPRPRPSPGR